MASEVTEWIRIIVQVTVACIAFTVGMNAAASDMARLWRERPLLGRSLLAVLVGAPVVAVLLVKSIPLPDEVAAGILVSAVAIGPVAAVKRCSKGDDETSFAVGLDIALLLASLVFVPVAGWLIGAAFERDVRLSASLVARVIVPLQLLPLLAGVAVGKLAPAFAARVGRPLAMGTNVVFGAVVLLVLFVFFQRLLAIPARGWLVITALSACAVMLGHWLGGPHPDDRRVLAAFTAMRFPALALAIAKATAQGLRAVPTILAYIIVSLATYALYSALSSRLPERAPPPTARSAPLRPPQS